MEQFLDPNEEDEEDQFQVLLLDVEDFDELVEEDDRDGDDVEDESFFDVVLPDKDRVVLKPSILVEAGVEIDEDGGEEDGDDREVDYLKEMLILIPVVIYNNFRPY